MCKEHNSVCGRLDFFLDRAFKRIEYLCHYISLLHLVAGLFYPAIYSAAFSVYRHQMLFFKRSCHITAVALILYDAHSRQETQYSAYRYICRFFVNMLCFVCIYGKCARITVLPVEVQCCRVKRLRLSEKYIRKTE